MNTVIYCNISLRTVRKVFNFNKQKRMGHNHRCSPGTPTRQPSARFEIQDAFSQIVLKQNLGAQAAGVSPLSKAASHGASRCKNTHHSTKGRIQSKLIPPNSLSPHRRLPLPGSQTYHPFLRSSFRKHDGLPKTSTFAQNKRWATS